MTEANQKGESARDPGVGSVNQPPAPITLAVYRDLRVGLAVTAVMVAAAIIIEWMATDDCWQAALSEYFYTSAHSIFIAALLGLATLFFVYRGSSDTEDALLTLAGVAALVAALVPQGRPEVCTPAFLPDDVKFDAVVRPNLVAVVVALVLGWALSMWQHRYNRSQQTRSVGGTLALYFLRLVVAGGLILLVRWPDVFSDHAHGAAGVLMLSAFIATVFSSAYLAKREEPSPDRRNYRAVLQVDRLGDAGDVDCGCHSAYQASRVVGGPVGHHPRIGGDPRVRCILGGSNYRPVGFT